MADSVIRRFAPNNNYYNANTDATSEERRKEAIQTVYRNFGFSVRTVGFAMIRYSGGYYHSYLFLGGVTGSGINCVVVEIERDFRRINCWEIDSNDEAIKKFSLQGT